MVGVPGRSKGCNTCRRRKKGCDLRRPACSQCLSTGRQCEGYGRQLNFVPYTGKSSGPEAANVQAKQVYVAQKAVVPVLLSRDMERQIWETSIVGSFWEVHLPRPEFLGSPYADFSTSISWKDLATCLQPSTNALRLSLLALSFTRLSLIDPSDPLCRQKGLQAYGEALKEQQAALQVERRRLSDEVLYSASILALHGIFQGASVAAGHDGGERHGTSWIAHTEGIASILERRGPERHVTGLPHRQFRSLKLTCLIARLQNRKKSFFNDPAWIQIPFSKHPRGLKDHILDILAKLPGLLENSDDIRAAMNSSNFSEDQIADWLHSVITECCSIDVALQEWLDKLIDFTHHHNPELEWPECLVSDPLGQDPHHYALAHITCIFWVCCCVTYTYLHQAVRDLRAIDPSRAPAHLSEHTQPGLYATNIRRATAFFYQPELGGIGPTNASFPMGMAMLYYGASGNMEELGLLMQHFNSKREGGAIKGFLNGLAQDGAEGKPVPRGVPVDAATQGRLMAIKWWGFEIVDELLLERRREKKEREDAEQEVVREAF